MRLVVFFFFLLYFSFAVNAQTLKGKVYDATGTVKNLKVFNDTQNRFTATNTDGDFSIYAKVNDTILFESVFYHPKVIIVSASHFEEIAVFELQKVTNKLDEVEIRATPEQPVFEVESYNLELQNLIQEDIKNNPHLYMPAGATYGIDFVYLIGAVVKLFKTKDKYKASKYKPISYKQMDSLFSTSSFFNKELITNNLNIPEKKVKLFLDFCSAKYMSSELLQDKNKMQLLEQLVLNSQLFLILLEQYGPENISKD